MFEFFDSKKKRPQRIVRIKITSGVNARPWDAKVARGYAVGEIVDCEAGDAAELVQLGRAERIGDVGLNGELLPPKAPEQRKSAPEYELKPYPEKWADLPKCFRQAWEFDEELTKAEHDVARLKKDYYSGGKAFVGDTVASEGARVARLLEKIQAAEDRLRSFDREGRARAFIACSDAALKEIRGANASRDAAVAFGFEIFKYRIAALGLAESKARSLFDGSADWFKYRLDAIIEPTTRTAGNGQVYIDAPLESAATLLQTARNLREVATAKIEEGKAELAAATTAPAAKKSKAA